MRRPISSRSTAAMPIPAASPVSALRRGSAAIAAAQPIDSARWTGSAAARSTGVRVSRGSRIAPAARAPSSTSSPLASVTSVDGTPESAAPASPAATTSRRSIFDAMFASVRCYFVHKATPAELAERVGEDFADALSERPGFVAYDFADCGEGEAISVSVFQEADQARASQALARRWTEDRLRDMELTITEALHGEGVSGRPGRGRYRARRGGGGEGARWVMDGGGERLSVWRAGEPLQGDVGAGEVLVSREAGVLT